MLIVWSHTHMTTVSGEYTGYSLPREHSDPLPESFLMAHVEEGISMPILQKIKT